MSEALSGNPRMAPGPHGGRAARLRARWAALPSRERQVASGVAVLLVLLLVWLLALQPALTTLRTAPARLAGLDAELQEMQGLAEEARQLRATPTLPAAQSADALRRATEMLGEQARITLQGDRATVTLSAVSPTALRDWLVAVRAAARARPIEATLSYLPGPGGGGWNGSVVLALGAPS